MPKRSRSSGGGVGSGAGSSESARGSRSTGGRDGRGEGDVGSRSAAQDFEESAHGGPESGSWAGGSGQSDVESAHDDVRR
jgi:hypothetical protein